MRVLQVINSLDIGGAEKRLLDITKHVDVSGVQLHYCTTSGTVGALGDDFRAAGAVIHPMRLDVRFPRRFKELLKKHDFVAVHAHMHYSSGFVLRLAARMRTPLRIAHFRSCNDGKGNSLRRRLQRGQMRRWIRKYATHILACGESAMVCNWGPDWRNDTRFRVIPNGLDPTLFGQRSERNAVCQEFGFSSRGPLFIHVGNIRPPKNHHKLLAVFSKIAEREPAANLLIVGRGENDIERELRRFSHQQGIVDRVTFAGVRHDVPRLLSAADAMIFPSLWEGLPGAVLEACAAGIPVLASDLPEIREISAHLPIVQHLPLTADNAIWADVALSLCRQHQDIGRAGRAAQFNMSPFHIAQCVRAHLDVWGQSQSTANNDTLKAA